MTSLTYTIISLIVLCSLLQIKSQDCGQRKINIQGLITNGYASEPGDWPWHTAIFHRIKRKFEYKCGGSIITQNTILTAAHCVFQGTGKLIPERLSVQVGRHKLTSADLNTEEHEVDSIIIHEKFDIFTFNNDIALLKLATELKFSNYIQPACLWNDDIDIRSYVGRPGTVVGWGLAENDKTTDILTQATMPIVDFITCLKSNRDLFGAFLTENVFCAGYKNGTSVCNGDSGGGMFFRVGNRWLIRGIVSFSATRDDDTDYCNPNEYVGFTDVAKYLTWIRTNLQVRKRYQISDHQNYNLINRNSCGLHKFDRAGPETSKQIFLNYPWMALLEFEVAPNVKKALCHGVLINDRYVVSAAHCVSDLPYTHKLSSVRLGEYDTEKTEDCEGNLCSAPLQIKIVASVVAHPLFNKPRFSNDIALIRFTTPADISRIEYVNPICLPATDDLRSQKLNYYILVGWKSGKQTSTLQRSIPRIQDSVQCQQKYTKYNIPLEKTYRQICVTNDFTQTGCSFNLAAAPLQAIKEFNRVERYILYGLLSFGPSKCDQDYPDVYTNIPTYIDWILDNIHE